MRYAVVGENAFSIMAADLPNFPSCVTAGASLKEDWGLI